jgi:hypothetical protein
MDKRNLLNMLAPNGWSPCPHIPMTSMWASSSQVMWHANSTWSMWRKLQLYFVLPKRMSYDYPLMVACQNGPFHPLQKKIWCYTQQIIFIWSILGHSHHNSLWLNNFIKKLWNHKLGHKHFSYLVVWKEYKKLTNLKSYEVSEMMWCLRHGKWW